MFRLGNRALFADLLQKLCLSIVSVLIVLVVLEVVFRLLDMRGYHVPRTREWSEALREADEMTPGVWLQFKPQSQFTLVYDSNPRGYFDGDLTLTYRLNNFGLRGPDYTVERRPGVKRIMVLGDSFTFGEGVRQEDTFCHRLEEILRNDKGIGVEVLNFGVSGWSTVCELNYLRHEGVTFKPDLVLLVYVLNDTSPKSGLDVFQEFIDVYERRALRHSYVLSFACMKYCQRRYLRRYVKDVVQEAHYRMYTWEESFAALAACKQVAASHGAGFAVAIFPFMYDLSPRCPFRDLHLMVRDRCVEYGIDVCDLLPAFIGNRHSDLWVHPSDPHPNEKGHAIAAGALADFVVAHNLLGESP